MTILKMNIKQQFQCCLRYIFKSTRDTDTLVLDVYKIFSKHLGIDAIFCNNLTPPVRTIFFSIRNYYGEIFIANTLNRVWQKKILIPIF